MIVSTSRGTSGHLKNAQSAKMVYSFNAVITNPIVTRIVRIDFFPTFILDS